MSFDRLAVWLARQLGRPSVFAVALVIVIAAIAAGMVPGMAEAVNTWGGALTGYIGVLLLLVLQNSQNREMAATQAKFDELLHATTGARDELIGLEERTSEEIAQMRQQRPE